MLLFAVRETFQESLGFSPFELDLDTMWDVTFERKMPLSTNVKQISESISYSINFNIPKWNGYRKTGELIHYS
jgi:RNAse (barnase) inhibitor barstar